MGTCVGTSVMMSDQIVAREVLYAVDRRLRRRNVLQSVASETVSKPLFKTILSVLENAPKWFQVAM